MTFQSILSGFIGATAEVFVLGSMYEGSLTTVQPGIIQVRESPVIYGEFVLVTIPTTSIEYVRILV